jgi:hypothetical protein
MSDTILKIILIMEKFIHQLKKNNKYSYNITLPKELIKKYGWRAKQKLIIADKGRGILEIKDQPGKKNK